MARRWVLLFVERYKQKQGRQDAVGEERAVEQKWQTLVEVGKADADL